MPETSAGGCSAERRASRILSLIWPYNLEFGVRVRAGIRSSIYIHQYLGEDERFGLARFNLAPSLTGVVSALWGPASSNRVTSKVR